MRAGRQQGRRVHKVHIQRLSAEPGAPSSLKSKRGNWPANQQRHSADADRPFVDGSGREQRGGGESEGNARSKDGACEERACESARTRKTGAREREQRGAEQEQPQRGKEGAKGPKQLGKEIPVQRHAGRQRGQRLPLGQQQQHVVLMLQVLQQGGEQQQRDERAQRAAPAAARAAQQRQRPARPQRSGAANQQSAQQRRIGAQQRAHQQQSGERGAAAAAAAAAGEQSSAQSAESKAPPHLVAPSLPVQQRHARCVHQHRLHCIIDIQLSRMFIVATLKQGHCCLVVCLFSCLVAVMNLEQQWNDVSLKHVNNMKLLRQVRARQVKARRERATRKAELQELGLQDEKPVYRSVGKAFMLATKPELEKEAQESLVEVSQNEEKFENQAKFLMSKVKENEQQMGELMRQQSGR